MRMKTIWMCEDRENVEESGFGLRKHDAQRYVSGNRGYDLYTGDGFKECVKDGWAKPAVRIKVPSAVAAVLLKARYQGLYVVRGPHR